MTLLYSFFSASNSHRVHSGSLFCLFIRFYFILFFLRTKKRRWRRRIRTCQIKKSPTSHTDASSYILSYRINFQPFHFFSYSGFSIPVLYTKIIVVHSPVSQVSTHRSMLLSTFLFACGFFLSAMEWIRIKVNSSAYRPQNLLWPRQELR